MMILYGRIIPGEPLKISDDDNIKDLKDNQKEEISEQYNKQLLDELKNDIEKRLVLSC